MHVSNSIVKFCFGLHLGGMTSSFIRTCIKLQPQHQLKWKIIVKWNVRWSRCIHAYHALRDTLTEINWLIYFTDPALFPCQDHAGYNSVCLVFSGLLNLLQSDLVCWFKTRHLKIFSFDEGHNTNRNLNPERMSVPQVFFEPLILWPCLIPDILPLLFFSKRFMVTVSNWV